MLKCKIILLIISFCVIKIVYAQGFGHCNFGNYPFGNCVIEAEEKISSTSGAEAGADVFASQAGVGLLYDVIVTIPRPAFLQEETIKATITIINKQGIPSKDAILNYYLLSPDNKIISEIQDVFLPEHQAKHTFTRELKLPQNTEVGQWKFVVVFNPVEEEPIRAFVSFEVITKQGLIQGSMILLLAVGIISIVIYETTMRKRII